MRQSLSSVECRALEALAPRASVAAKLLDGWSQVPGEAWRSVRDLVELAGLGLTEETAVRAVIADLAALGLTIASSEGDKLPLGNRHVLQRLALALHGIAFYSANVHRDETVAQIVLTRPPQPSALEQQLVDRGWRAGDIRSTRETFVDLVRSARKRVLVMTPFLDNRGADWLCDLFDRVDEGVQRVLVLRTLENPQRPDYPTGYPYVADRLRQAGVRVFNYSIPRAQGSGRETFHAKVVLCDADHGYVGSSNLTTASLEHSMELGISLTGRAASKLAEVMEAVLSCATAWPYPDSR